MLLLLMVDTEPKLSHSLRSASYFLLGGQEKVAKEKATPLGACRACARQVREPGPGFSTGLLSGRKGIDIHVDARFAA